MSDVTRRSYGVVTVVRNALAGAAYASADGPEGLPVIVSANLDSTDAEMIVMDLRAADHAWGDLMPRALRDALNEALSFDPLVMLEVMADRGPTKGLRLYSGQTIDSRRNA